MDSDMFWSIWHKGDRVVCYLMGGFWGFVLGVVAAAWWLR